MSKELAIKKRQHGVDANIIVPVKGFFRRTQTQEIIQSRLYKNLQRALSFPEYFFHGNKNLLRANDTSHNRQIFDLIQSHIIYDPKSLPEKFIELFNIDLQSETIQEELEKIFKRSRLLDRNSGRIVFIDDKIIIFRNEKTLVHTQGKLTKGEKNRTQISTTFNTFSNIYDAVRSQYHAINSSQDNQDAAKIAQHKLIKLAQEIRLKGIDIKDYSFKRQIDTIIDQIKGARNFRTLGAQLHNLSEIRLTNPSIDQNLLTGAKNKFNKRFADLQNMIGVMNTQLNDLENILKEHEGLLEIFISQDTFTDQSLCLQNYQNGYLKLKIKYGEISPFNIFYKLINKYYQTDESLKFLTSVNSIFETFKQEHAYKLGLQKASPQEEALLEEFLSIKNNLPLLEHIINS